MQDMPYFMKDQTWFYFNGKEYVLTEKAPQKAVESLKEYYDTEREMGYG